MNKVDFYEETHFEGSLIGKIPKDWEIADADSISVLKGFAFSSNFFNGNSEGLPLIRIRDLRKEETESYYSGPYDETYLIRKGDILVSMDGQFNAYLWNGPEGLLNQRVCKVWSKNPAQLDNLFLYYAIHKPLKTIERQTSQTTVKHLLDRHIERMKFLLPPYSEQREVAQILAVVDLAVGKADEVIAKTERLKKGLMQELLTKGIGHKEFKDTKIGKAPKEWEVVRLEDVCITITDGSHWSPKEVEKSDYRIATVANLGETDIDINSCKLVSKRDFMRLVRERDVPEKGDVLFSKDGTVGISFAFRQHDFNVGLLSSIAIIRPNPQLLSSEFCAYALKSPKVFWQIIGRKTGTALRRIILGHLKTVKIPLPSFAEQEKIAEILSSVDRKLEFERKEKTKLERIKWGLMDLLLTGKVRVKVAD